MATFLLQACTGELVLSLVVFNTGHTAPDTGGQGLCLIQALFSPSFYQLLHHCSAKEGCAQPEGVPLFALNSESGLCVFTDFAISD